MRVVKIQKRRGNIEADFNYVVDDHDLAEAMSMPLLHFACYISLSSVCRQRAGSFSSFVRKIKRKQSEDGVRTRNENERLENSRN